MLGRFSHVWLFATLWTVACLAPLSMRFSRQEYWSGLSRGSSPPRDQTCLLRLLHWQEGSLPLAPPSGSAAGSPVVIVSNAKWGNWDQGCPLPKTTQLLRKTEGCIWTWLKLKEELVLPLGWARFEGSFHTQGWFWGSEEGAMEGSRLCIFVSMTSTFWDCADFQFTGCSDFSRKAL